MGQSLPDPGTTVDAGPVRWRVAPGETAFIERVRGLRHDAAGALPGLEVLKEKPGRFWGRLRTPGGDCFLKGRKIDRWRRRLRTLFRRSGMRDEWRKAWWLIGRGIETPAPVAVGEVRRFGMVRECFFSCRWLDGARPLRAYLEAKAASLDPTRLEQLRRRVVRLLGRLLGRLHAVGAYHWEFHDMNILAAEDADGSLRLLPIDLDHLVIPRRFTEEDRAWSFHQIAWYLRKPIARFRPGPRDRARFIKGYHEAVPDSARDWKTLFLQLEASLASEPLATRPRRRRFRAGRAGSGRHHGSSSVSPGRRG